MSMFSGYVPMKHLTSLRALKYAIREGSPDLSTDELDKAYGFSSTGFMIDGEPVNAERDVEYSPSRITTSWSRRVLSGAITVNDIYQNSHLFQLPNDVSGRNSKETVWGSDSAPHVIKTSIFVTYSLFGIDSNDWAGWSGMSRASKMPHQVYEYNLICEEFGVAPITFSQYVTFLKSMKIRTGILPANSITKWARMAKALAKIGADHSSIQDFGFWVSDGWSHESIKKLTDAGITHKVASELWDSGLKNSDLIFRNLVEGLPIEWALDIHAARVEQ